MVERAVPRVSTDIRDRIALVRLEDPARRNAMGGAMADELIAVFDEIEGRDDVGSVIVSGAGRSFCAGADLEDLMSGDRGKFERVYRSFMRVYASPLPKIAAVNGPAVGAGLNLALACDVRLAGRSARFVSRFTEIGLHPGGGHAWMLIDAVGRQTAAAMMLFGHELDGDGAARAGLALASVDDGELLSVARSLASAAATVPRALSSRVKETIALMRTTRSYEDAVALEADAQLWSATQPVFKERITQLAERIRRARTAGSDAR